MLLQAIQGACEFLLGVQCPDGGWGESYLSCQDKASWGLLIVSPFPAVPVTSGQRGNHLGLADRGTTVAENDSCIVDLEP